MASDQLQSDIAELDAFVQQAQSANVKAILERESSKLKAQLQIKLREAELEKKRREGVLLKKEAASSEIQYTMLSTYAWEQAGEFIKVYVDLEGVGGVNPENLKASFQQQSFEFLIHDLNGKNYKFSLSNLAHEINTKSSSFKTTSKRIVFNLKKANSEYWSSIQAKEDPFKSKPKLDKDPSAGLMDMMKKMYDEGDDDMKRTIAQAWTDSRNKAGAAPGL